MKIKTIFKALVGLASGLALIPLGINLNNKIHSLSLNNQGVNNQLTKENLNDDVKPEFTYEYSYEKDGYLISGCSNWSTIKDKITELVIPAVYKDNTVHRTKPVIGIKDNHSSTVFASSKSLKILSFEQNSSFERIGDSAFSDCSSLKTINWPSNLISIGARAFNGCDALEEVELPSSLLYISNGAFDDCESLSKVKIPENSNLKNISDYAFHLCANLETVNFPSKLINIGDYAFLGCTKLSSINIPSSVMTIGESAFGDCTGLKNIQFNYDEKTLDQNIIPQINWKANIGEHVWNNIFVEGNKNKEKATIHIDRNASDSLLNKYKKYFNSNLGLSADNTKYLTNVGTKSGSIIGPVLAGVFGGLLVLSQFVFLGIAIHKKKKNK